MVKARTVCDPSEAKPSTPGSLPGTVVNALTIRPITGAMQMMPTSTMMKVSFHPLHSGEECLETSPLDSSRECPASCSQAAEGSVVAAERTGKVFIEEEEDCITGCITFSGLEYT